jgi:hypothetical protein
MKDERGQTAVSGLLFTLILALIVAFLVDVYSLKETRSFAYDLASEAALIGAARGRDFSHFISTGEIRILEDVAREEALEVIVEGMGRRGITDYEVRIEVLPEGGTVFGFPPVPRASQFGSSDFSSEEPAVGVYLAIPVRVYFFGLVVGGESVTVHVFAASGIASAE